MKEPIRTQSVAREDAILVSVVLPKDKSHLETLNELEGLAQAVGVEVVGRLSQRRTAPVSSTYLGKGKVEELRQMAESMDAQVILFDNELSPAQTRNLEEATDVKVLDRSELILDIFATRARTPESRLAVELAQLEYSLPRLKRMWTHLSRLNMGVGMRGPGEKQLEVDRRLAEKRISDLKNQLQKIQTRRRREVKSRKDVMTVSLVGYTNSGKSTLLNALTGADIYTADTLFATLETRTRRWQLPGWGPILLSDTVGFIRNLPHHLIASFKATLEETRQADLLLHVADASNPAVLDQIRSVNQVLTELEVDETLALLVINKIDAVPGRVTLDKISKDYPHAIAISASTGDGLGPLTEAVSQALSSNFLEVDVETSVENGRLLAFLAAHGEVLSKRFGKERVTVHCRIAQKYIGQIRGVDIQIRTHALGGRIEKLPVAEAPSPMEGPLDETAGKSIEDVA